MAVGGRRVGVAERRVGVAVGARRVGVGGTGVNVGVSITAGAGVAVGVPVAVGVGVSVGVGVKVGFGVLVGVAVTVGARAMKDTRGQLQLMVTITPTHAIPRTVTLFLFKSSVPRAGSQAVAFPPGTVVPLYQTFAPDTIFWRTRRRYSRAFRQPHNW